MQEALWDATHVVTASVDEANNKAKYRVNSAVFFQLDAENQETFGTLDCGCSVLRVKEEYFAIDTKPGGDIIQFHLRKIGRMIEENERSIKTDLHSSYINKTKQIINTGRIAFGYGNKEDDFTKELNEAILARGKS